MLLSKFIAGSLVVVGWGYFTNRASAGELSA